MTEENRRWYESATVAAGAGRLLTPCDFIGSTVRVRMFVGFPIWAEIIGYNLRGDFLVRTKEGRELTVSPNDIIG